MTSAFKDKHCFLNVLDQYNKNPTKVLDFLKSKFKYLYHGKMPFSITIIPQDYNTLYFEPIKKTNYDESLCVIRNIKYCLYKPYEDEIIIKRGTIYVIVRNGGAVHLVRDEEN